jgi:hypothetical protein
MALSVPILLIMALSVSFDLHLYHNLNNNTRDILYSLLHQHLHLLSTDVIISCVKESRYNLKRPYTIQRRESTTRVID